MTTINLGKVRITDKGVWVPDYAGGYGILDVVTFEKGSYMSKVSANSAALTDRASWVPFVDTASIEQAIQEANEAAGLADQARLAIEGNLAKLELADAEHSSQIKSIENVLSTANLGQSAQLSVSGRKVVSLPKNASNGGMQVKLEGLTAENLVANGDFRNGLTGWSLYAGGAALAIEGDYLTYISNVPSQAISQTGKSFATGDKLYVHAIMKVDETPTILTAGIGLSGVGASLLAGVTVGVTDTVVRGIITAASNLTSIVFGRTDTANKKVYLKKGARVINLTQIFGAGKEPDAATCDAMFSTYFEGTKSMISTGRIRSVGKNLFKLNPFISTQFANGVEMIQGGYSTSMLNYQTSYNNGVYAFLQNKSVVAKISNIKFEVGKQYTIQSKSYMGNGTVVYNRITIFHTDGTSVTGNNPSEGGVIVVTSSQGKTVQYITFSNYGANGFYGNYPVNSIMAERSVSYSAFESFRDTNLYLTAPELRSNGLVKDEIRKGANGYELVKRAGVGYTTIGSDVITNKDFLNASWLTAGTVTKDSSNSFTSSGNGGVRILLSGLTVGKWYLISFQASTTALSCNLYNDNSGGLTNKITSGNGVYLFLAVVTGLYIRNEGSGTTTVNGFTAIETSFTSGTPISPSIVTNGNYTLATPVITPISYGGVLNSAENGTVYHEPVIADAGVYGTNMPILLPDYPIASIEEIIVHKDGIDTYLDVSTAVIAPDGLSFTHPDLASGDLVLFTYAFDKESTNGNITATFYDSNVVKIDTVTGKAYRINEVVTNGVLTRTLTEV